LVIPTPGIIALSVGEGVALLFQLVEVFQSVVGWLAYTVWAAFLQGPGK
jgi:hypothetical protein